MCSVGKLRNGYQTSDADRCHISAAVLVMEKVLFFTLVELLVVIAIIMMLMAILLPALSKAKEMSKQAACTSNQRQLGLAFQNYSVDFNDYMMADYATVLNKDSYVEVLQEGGYVSCPPYKQGEVNGIFKCPSETRLQPDATRHWKGTQYGGNVILFHPSVCYSSWVSVVGGKAWRYSRVVSPSRTLYTGDAAYDGFGTILHWADWGNCLPVPRHNNAWNALLVDGHVAKLNAIPPYAEGGDYNWDPRWR